MASDCKKADKIPELSIQYAKDSSYPPELTKKKKSAVRKHTSLLTVDKSEVSINCSKTKATLPSHLDSSLSYKCL